MDHPARSHHGADPGTGGERVLVPIAFQMERMAVAVANGERAQEALAGA